MQDKIALLMEETGCDRGEAELTLEMCGYDVEKAIRAIPRLLKNIAVLKGKFLVQDSHQFGLILVILNIKSRILLRSRAVVSYNPAVYSVPLDKDWFEFEKHLYGCRLWEGSLQAESQEIEQRLADLFRGLSAAGLYDRLGTEPGESGALDISSLLKGFFLNAGLTLNVKKDILDLGQFRALKSDPEFNPLDLPRKHSRSGALSARAADILELRISLEEAEDGMRPDQLRPGDAVSVRIEDGRDIARYICKLLGGLSDAGPVPINAPVEAVEPEGGQQKVRVRFAVGVCGEALCGKEARFRAVRQQDQGEGSWWQRLKSRVTGAV